MMTTIAGIDLVTLIWKATALFGAGVLIELVLWRRPASARHVVWSSVVIAALLLPLVSAAVPKWTIPLWEDLVPAPAVVLFHADAVGRASVGPAIGNAAAPEVSSGRGSAVNPLPWVAMLWLSGAVAVGFQTLAGVVSVTRLRRRAVPAPESVVAAAHEVAAAMGLRRSVHLWTVVDATTPMTWGVWFPSILLPESLTRGEPERLREILAHELAHIARRDYAVHLLSQMACALYWFHPLAWIGRSRLLRLQERACDDAVLALGARPSDYARSLVTLSRSLSAPRLCGSLGICRPSTLESRVRAILNPRLRRGRLAPAAVCVALVAALGVATFTGAVTPVLAQSPEVAMPAPAVALMMVAAWGQRIAAAAAQTPDLESLESEAVKAAAAFDVDKAAALYKQIAEIKKTRFGAGSAQYAQELIRLGALYRAWDRLEEALPLYAQARNIFERSFGPTYPGLATPLYILALDAHLRGDTAAAETLYRRVVGLMEQPASAESALAKRGLDILAQQQGNPPAEGIAAVPKSGLMEFGMATTDWPAVPAQATRTGGGVNAPRLTAKVEPQYSREARLAKHEGTVVLQAIIAADGKIHEVRIQKAVGLGLDAKAVDAVRQWEFQPGTKDGAPVPVVASIEVNFRLL